MVQQRQYLPIQRGRRIGQTVPVPHPNRTALDATAGCRANRGHCRPSGAPGAVGEPRRAAHASNAAGHGRGPAYAVRALAVQKAAVRRRRRTAARHRADARAGNAGTDAPGGPGPPVAHQGHAPETAVCGRAHPGRRARAPGVGTGPPGPVIQAAVDRQRHRRRGVRGRVQDAGKTPRRVDHSRGPRAVPARRRAARTVAARPYTAGKRDPVERAAHRRGPRVGGSGPFRRGVGRGQHGHRRRLAAPLSPVSLPGVHGQAARRTRGQLVLCHRRGVRLSGRWAQPRHAHHGHDSRP